MHNHLFRVKQDDTIDKVRHILSLHLLRDLVDICVDYSLPAIVPVAEWNLENYWWDPWVAEIQLACLSNETIAASICGQIKTFTMQGQLVEEWKGCDDIYDIAVCPKGNLVLHRGAADIETRDVHGKLVSCLKDVAVRDIIRRIACGPQGEIVLVYNGFTNDVEIRDQRGRVLHELDDSFLKPQAVAVLLNGDYVMVDAKKDCVQVFDSCGNFIRRWGRHGSGKGEFSEPRDVVVMPTTGIVIVADSENNRIQAFTQEGKYLDQWGFTSDCQDKVAQVEDVAVLPGDEIVTVDSTWHRVQVYTPDGQLLRQWGKQGSGPSEFNRPLRLAISTGRKRVVAVYDSSCRLQLFTPKGKFLREWKVPNPEFGKRIGLSWISPQDLAVADGFCVRLYNKKGQSVKTWEHLKRPFEVTLLADGYIAVLESGTHSISFLDLTGQVVERHDLHDRNIRSPTRTIPFADGKYAITEMNGRVHFFSPSGKFLHRWDVDSMNFCLAQLSDRRLIVSNGDTMSMNVMSLQGKILAEFGRWGSRLGEFLRPLRLAVLPRNQLAVSAFRPDKIQATKGYTQARVFMFDLSRLKI